MLEKNKYIGERKEKSNNELEKINDEFNFDETNLMDLVFIVANGDYDKIIKILEIPIIDFWGFLHYYNKNIKFFVKNIL